MQPARQCRRPRPHGNADAGAVRWLLMTRASHCGNMIWEETKLEVACACPSTSKHTTCQKFRVDCNMLNNNDIKYQTPTSTPGYSLRAVAPAGQSASHLWDSRPVCPREITAFAAPPCWRGRSFKLATRPPPARHCGRCDSPPSNVHRARPRFAGSAPVRSPNPCVWWSRTV